ncbi:anthranilate synthase component I family protein [Olivibacter sp. XZL3]|uniref:anthranilate synthase component I family protein n=1 Tax=Olivibacter sp. XZL3 TaxID=1735116 RepID=UPI001065A7B3|nr:anthranilate synthase component I family protein [Olivibacter sp. XZL3]
MPSVDYQIDPSHFTKKALQWASLFNTACGLLSNGRAHDPYSKFDALIAAGTAAEFTGETSANFQALQAFLNAHQGSWIPGFLAYDLKNEIETLNTSHPSEQQTPNAYFFVPKHLILIKGDRLTIESDTPTDIIYEQIVNTALPEKPFVFHGKIEAKMAKENYIAAFQQLQRHIHQGDIYEVNLCQEFFAEDVALNPIEAYYRLSDISPTPFSAYFKAKEHHIISASPERFLAKRDRLLISQPIKGTAPRGKTKEEDSRLLNKLKADKKEISENIMIVDLVRNDLTKSAEPASVNVAELMGVYTFKQVHQLISTITAREKDQLELTESIKNTFPAGSMTGAPKVNAMRLIDQYESSGRGIYAGSIGYFAPDGDYDFNVVIRTLLYNTNRKRLSFHVGGAITAEANALNEYQECLLKASAILQLLGVSYSDFTLP